MSGVSVQVVPAAEREATFPSNAAPPPPVVADAKRPDGKPPRLAEAKAPGGQSLSPEEITAFVKRGDKLLKGGDIASARLYYERAAEAGDGSAALRVGETFDPVFLGRVGVRGMPGDPQQAFSWYRRARDLGEAEAERRLTSWQPSKERLGEPLMSSVGSATSIENKRLPRPVVSEPRAVPMDSKLAEPADTVPKAQSPVTIAKSAPALSAADPRPFAAEIIAFLTRGDALVGAGDIASARLFYERAADAGDGRAALRLGATFDPAFLARAGIRGMPGDPGQALSWYRRAHDLGEGEAERWLKSLETRPTAEPDAGAR
jgi:TPR repeat protein